MKQLALKIFNAGIIILLLTGILVWPEPVQAGVSEWSAEAQPSIENSVLGPTGIDIRDYAIGDDDQTIYAVPGDSIAGLSVYKSVNAGATWTAINIAPQKADLIAVAPDDKNMVVYADNTTRQVFLSINGGTTWGTLGTFAGCVIRDIAISPALAGKHYIAVAGRTAGNTAELWYYPYGDLTASWQTTSGQAGFSAETEIATVAFSPGFTWDTALAAVSGNTTTGVNLQVLNLGSLLWNGSASYTGFPCPIVSVPITGIKSASLALAPTYDGSDEDYRNLFISLTLDGDIPNSGIYRFKDTVKSDILLNKQVHSLTYNGNYLAAGSYSDTTVYRVATPMGTTWTVNTYNTNKNPGGDDKVLVSFMGNTITAGTCGNESSFSISSNYGATFTDISLIDTLITNARDVAVTATASKVYYVTDDGTDTSVWYKTAATWNRVLCLKSSINYLIRIERISGSMVYLARKGGVSSDIYVNSSSGNGQWQIRPCIFNNIQDIAVESTSVIYVLSADGKVVKSANAGQIWGPAVLTTLTNGNMISLISSGKLLAGSQDGFVAYSLDSGTNWTKISKQFDTLGGSVQVIADQNYNTNKTIYAANQAAGRDIKKWQIGISTDWTDIFNGVVTGGIYGLAIDTNTLYALETNAGQSRIWRYISPTTATATSPDWIGIGVTPGSDPVFALDSGPQALKVSSSKLWAVTTNFASNKLYSFTDVITDLEITLSQPVNGFLCRVNSINGLVNDVTLSWPRPSIASEYQVQVAFDRDFAMMTANFTIVTTNSNVFATIGPSQVFPFYVNFTPNTTYYWRVRTSKPGFSLYSEIRSFAVEPIPVSPTSGVGLLGPANGMVLTDNTPAFSWSPVQGTTEYEFMLSDNPEMATPLLNAKVDTTAIEIIRKLERGKTYFWCVRAVSPIYSDWSAAGNFILAEEVIIPVSTPATTPTFTINLPTPVETKAIAPPVDTTVKQIVPPYLVIAIFLGLTLTGVVGYLIFKQPRKITVQEVQGLGPVRRQVTARKQPVSPAEMPLSALETPKAVLPSVPKTNAPPPASEPLTPEEKITAKPLKNLSKDAETVIFAAKSFMWIAGTEPGTSPDQDRVSLGKERLSLGKKLAGRIRDLAKKEPLYIKHPEDAALLLDLWAHYGSRDETAKYLANSFKDRPENAVRFLKCFLPSAATGGYTEAEDFNDESYKTLAKIVDTDTVYAALTKSSKFKLKTADEAIRVSPADSNLISRFTHLHLQNKNKD